MSDRYLDNNGQVRGMLALRDGIGFILVIIMLLMGGCPIYNVWQQGLAGEADLKRAKHDRQITIEEAAATRAASTDLAEAEVIRARGVAQANDIIANGLGGPQGYLRYLWIQKMDDANMIYVPTEAGMPILEAGRGVNKE